MIKLNRLLERRYRCIVYLTSLPQLHICAIFLGESSSSQHRLQRSISSVGQPIAHFKETQSYKSVRSAASEHRHRDAILHCYGFPGAGKSQIMRKIARESPYCEAPVSVRWHMECKDKKQSVKHSFAGLVAEIYRNNLAPQDSAPQASVLSALQNNRSESFVNLLISLSVPVLIIAEDVSKKNVDTGDYELFLDFECCLGKNVPRSESPIHVYKTTRMLGNTLQTEENESLYREQNRVYKTIKIEGFIQDEAINYLLPDCTGASRQERESAIDIWKRFSGSPLGIRTAKAYCKEYKLSYVTYIERLKEDEVSVRELESELLKEEYGPSVHHIFHAITMQFKPGQPNDTRSLQVWKVLKCLSYLHYTCIPRFLVKRFCQYFRSGDETPNARDANRRDADYLIQKLKRHELCNVNNNGDMTFHEVVFHAFRTCKEISWDVNPIVCAVKVIASVSCKDLRHKKYTKKVLRLLPHILSLLDNIERMNIGNGDDPMFQLLIGHVYEVFGAHGCRLALEYKERCNKYLQKALEIVYEVAFNRSMSFPEFENTHREAQDTRDVDKLIEECRNAGNKLDSGFIDNYIQKVLVLRPNSHDFQFLQKLCADGQVSTRLTQVKKTLEANPDTTLEILRELRDCGVFLEEKDYANIFFGERIASILHSASRIIFDQDNATYEEHERRLWMSNMTFAISRKCRNQFGTGLLHEHISQLAGVVPIKLITNKLQTDPNMKKRELRQLKLDCENAIQKNRTLDYQLYEHGLARETKGGVYNELRMKRQIVRIHTSLVRDVSITEFIEEGRAVCNELFRDACSNTDEMVAFKCFVHCGKFFTAIGKHQEAIRCYQKFFDAEEESSVRPPYYIHAWAVSNYGESVHKGRLLDLYENVVCRCREVNNSTERITMKVHNQLRELPEKLI
ncbi:uncharacterized protein LOC104265769 isoform X1 [Ciona intestinalis]